MELGVYTFGEAVLDPAAGKAVDSAQRVRDLLAQIELADQVGLDVYGVGEHHRPDYLLSTPVVLLAAAAERTKRIRLSSAVTVLSSDDPVRVFQQFATVDLISNGRAEIMAGRGSFIESFPLFGYNLDDYDELFTEKLELLLKIRANERVTWSGKHRAPINGRGVYPRPVQNPLPVWIAVGGTPESVVRAGMLGLPLAQASISGEPERWAPLVALYRQTGRDAGHDPRELKVSLNVHAFVADTSQEAADTFFPTYAVTMSRIGGERGFPPVTREHYDKLRGPRGALAVGSVQEVIDKIMRWYEVFKLDRFLAQLNVGVVPHAKVMRAIELYGTKVAPVVRKEVARRASAGTPTPTVAG